MAQPPDTARIEAIAEHAVNGASDRDEQLAAFYGGEAERGYVETPGRQEEARILRLRDVHGGNSAPEQEGRPSLFERLDSSLTPFDDEELEAAKQPHPHAFQTGECGLFPVGEVTVIGAPGREGKTRATFALAVSYVLGTHVVGLGPQPSRSVLIYSAEDSRDQYARLSVAHRHRLGQHDAALVRERIIVPDLATEDMAPFATLIGVNERRPVATLAVDVVIDVLRARMASSAPPGLLIFETASTLSDAEEDNSAFRAMARALRRIAREIDAAVVLVHHTSQAAGNNLADLNVSTADIRGGTALVFNARQCHLLVNLGSEDDPHGDNDLRTMLRRMALPTASGRATVLIPLDSSKALDPPPVFFEWHSTPYGPALATTPASSRIDGARWRKVRQMIRGERAEQRAAAKDEARHGGVMQVVRIVREMVSKDLQPTARAVSIGAGHSATWAKPYLDAAVESGELTARPERVPRARGETVVYRPKHSTEGVA